MPSMWSSQAVVVRATALLKKPAVSLALGLYLATPDL